MKNSFLDPKKFKHISSDKNITVLQHADGHTLTLAHNALSADVRKQLSALSSIAKDDAKPDEVKHFDEGGSTDDQFGYEKSKTPRKDSSEQIKRYKGAQKGFEEGTTPTPTPTPQQYAGGGMTANLLEGTDLPPALNEDQLAKRQDQDNERQKYNDFVASKQLSGNPQPYNPSASQFGPQGQAPQNFDPDAWKIVDKNFTQAKEDDAKAKDESLKASSKKIEADNVSRAQAGLPSLPQPMDSTSTTAPQQVSEPADQMPAQPASGQDQPYPTAQGMLQQGYNDQIKGVQQQAEAEGALGRAREQVFLDDQAEKVKIQNNFNEQYHKLGNEIDGTIQDIKDNHISPENYWKDHSKLATGIGIILAGFNPTSNPNAAIDNLHKMMDQNLRAQEADLGRKNNMLSAYYHQFGNLKDATEMTRLTQAGIVADKLEQAAATATTPMAKAAALKASGQIKADYAPRFQAFGMQQAVMKAANSGNVADNEANLDRMIAQTHLLNPELGKTMSAARVQGYGMTRNLSPVPEEIKRKLEASAQLDMTAKDLLQFAKTHTTLNPLSADYNTGVQKVLNLQNQYRESDIGGIFKQGDQPLLDKISPENPAGVNKSWSTIPKLLELISANDRKRYLTAKQQGLQVPQNSSQTAGVLKPKTFKLQK